MWSAMPVTQVSCRMGNFRTRWMRSLGDLRPRALPDSYSGRSCICDISIESGLLRSHSSMVYRADSDRSLLASQKARNQPSTPLLLTAELVRAQHSPIGAKQIYTLYMQSQLPQTYLFNVSAISAVPLCKWTTTMSGRNRPTHLSINFLWNSDRKRSLTNSPLPFFSSTPAAWFLKIRSSSHLRFTAKVAFEPATEDGVEGA